MSRNKTKQIEADELSDIEQLTECLFALNRSVTRLRQALQSKETETETRIEDIRLAHSDSQYGSHENDDDTCPANTIGELRSQIQLTSEEIQKLTKKPTLH